MTGINFVTVYRHFNAVHLKVVVKRVGKGHLCLSQTTTAMNTLLAMQLIHTLIKAATQVHHFIQLSGHLIK